MSTHAQARPDYFKISPEIAKKYLDFSMALKDGSIDRTLRDLVNIRVSQMNGCAFCVDMHVKEAKIAGERELRVHHVAIWRESALFDARERAALEWAEALTDLPPHGIPDELYARVSAALGEKAVADLTFCVIGINGWNRASIGFRTVPGSRDAAYGLTKAGLI